jgi:hypothetical protein
MVHDVVVMHDVVAVMMNDVMAMMDDVMTVVNHVMRFCRRHCLGSASHDRRKGER